MSISFITCAFGVISKKLLPNLRSQRFTLMFSSKSFMVLGPSLALWSILRFWGFFFRIWCEAGAQSQSLSCGFLVVPAPFVDKTILFALWIVLELLLKNQQTIEVNACPTYVYVCPYAHTTLSRLGFETRTYESSNFMLFQDCFSLKQCGSLELPYEF